LAALLREFAVAAEKLQLSITPSQAATIAEMGGGEFFDPRIADEVRESISTNAMTPSVASTFVQGLAQRRAGFLQNVKRTQDGLEKLNVRETPLAPGQADLSFLIPRELFDNSLGAFAKEVGFISRLLQNVSEGLTGQREQAQLEGLSSSVPTITVESTAAVIAVLALIVDKFLGAWERIEKIRKMRNELSEMGLKGAAVEELSEQVTNTVEEIVEESTSLVLKGYNGPLERKNELGIGVTTDVRRLFGQIERGLTIEFRAEPAPNDDQGSTKDLATIADVGRQLNFPAPANEPLLLAGPEVLEGELSKRTYKKSSTTKTTTGTKRGPKKASNESDE
jgi:hypothetical protein